MDRFTVVSDAPMLLGESPVWRPADNALFWIDIAGQTVWQRRLADGREKHWRLPSEPGCIALCRDGRLVVAMRSGIAFLDSVTGELSPVMAAPYDVTTTRFNDGKCDAAGRFWLGTIYEPRDKPLAALYCLDKGTLTKTGNFGTVSNGLAFSPDSHTLYHADTTSHVVRSYDFDLITGHLGNGRELMRFETQRGPSYGGRPDGAAVDSEGNYWCAMYEGARIIKISPYGRLLDSIPVPVRCPTMVAFGGDDLQTLFITSVSQNRPKEELAAYPLSGHVFATRVTVPGLPAATYLP